MRKKLSELEDGKQRSLAGNSDMSHDEAAAYLGITPQTLHNWNNKKRGPRSIRRFGRRYYVAADLDAFLKNEQEVKGAYR